MASERDKIVDFCRENGPQIGDIKYWNGEDWVCLPAGTDGQILVIGSSGYPEWQDPPA